MGSESLKVVLDKRVNLSPTARAPYFASSFISYGYQQKPSSKTPIRGSPARRREPGGEERKPSNELHPTPFSPVLYAVLYSSIIQPYPSSLAKAKQSFLLTEHISTFLVTVQSVPFIVTVCRPPFFFFGTDRVRNNSSR